jgi:NADH-quinone oxidoreductase subunit K
MAVPLEAYLVFSGLLFMIGLYGVLTRTNAIIVLMCVELMLNAANVNFVAFSAFSGSVEGQAFALFSIAIAAAEVAIGLAILLALFQKHGTIELDRIKLLRW